MLNDGVYEGYWTPTFTYHAISKNVGMDIEIRGDNLRFSISPHSAMPYRGLGSTELAKFKVEDDILSIPVDNEHISIFLASVLECPQMPREIAMTFRIDGSSLSWPGRSIAPSHFFSLRK